MLKGSMRLICISLMIVTLFSTTVFAATDTMDNQAKLGQAINSTGGVVLRSTSIPTSVFKLGSRSTTYSFSNYIYSDYVYTSSRDDHMIIMTVEPDSNQTMKIECYDKANNSLVEAHTYKLSPRTIQFFNFKKLKAGGQYYFKYISVDKARITGNICAL